MHDHAEVRGAWTGTGPPVVLLHGQPGSAADWEPVLPYLPGLRLLIPTRPGYDGGSATSLAANAGALVDLLDATRVKRVVVAGHSLGGGVALQLALDHPDRVRSLCLLSSVGSPLALTAVDRLLGAPLVRSVAAEGMRRVGSRAAWALATAAGSRLDRTQRRDLRLALSLWTSTGAWTAFAREQAAFVRDAPGLGRRLGEVTVPALVVVGSRDRTVPPAVGRDLAARLPGGQVHQIAAGHLMTLESPAQVAAAVRLAVALAGDRRC